MGIGGISIWQLLIILLIVALIFGTKKLRNVGGDIGGAVKGFKKAITSDDKGEEKEEEGEESDVMAQAEMTEETDKNENAEAKS